MNPFATSKKCVEGSWQVKSQIETTASQQRLTGSRVTVRMEKYFRRSRLRRRGYVPCGIILLYRPLRPWDMDGL